MKKFLISYEAKARSFTISVLSHFNQDWGIVLNWKRDTRMGNDKEFSEAMSENGNIQLLSQNDYISPSPMVASESFPRADCCIPLCQRLR